MIVSALVPVSIVDIPSPAVTVSATAALPAWIVSASPASRAEVSIVKAVA